MSLPTFSQVYHYFILPGWAANFLRFLTCQTLSYMYLEHMYTLYVYVFFMDESGVQVMHEKRNMGTNIGPESSGSSLWLVTRRDWGNGVFKLF